MYMYVMIYISKLGATDVDQFFPTDRLVQKPFLRYDDLFSLCEYIGVTMHH